MGSEPVLTLRDVGFSAGGRALVRGVSLDLRPGLVHGLLGPNGAGKSSLLRLLYRAQRPASGAIRLRGREIGTIPRRAYAAEVGALVQEQASLSGLTLREVAALGLLPLRLPQAEMRARCDAALAAVDLARRAGEDAARLSGGERQRLFFAQILALDPAISLLDEPHNHLDLHWQHALLTVLKARGRTVLASFHDLTLAARYCDHLFLMDAGEVVAEGPPEAVLTRENLARIYRIDARLEGGRLEVTGPLPGCGMQGPA